MFYVSQLRFFRTEKKKKKKRKNHRLDDSSKAATAQFTDAAKGAQGDLVETKRLRLRSGGHWDFQ